MIPRLGDGNPSGAFFTVINGNPSLENDSPSRGRKLEVVPSHTVSYEDTEFRK